MKTIPAPFQDLKASHQWSPISLTDCISFPFALLSTYKFSKDPQFIHASGPLQLLFPLPRKLCLLLFTGQPLLIHISVQIPLPPRSSPIALKKPPLQHTRSSAALYLKDISHLFVPCSLTPFPTKHKVYKSRSSVCFVQHCMPFPHLQYLEYLRLRRGYSVNIS